MINGNGRDRGMKIQHWNKGPTHLVNKHHEIEVLIDLMYLASRKQTFTIIMIFKMFSILSMISMFQLQLTTLI